jgi:hypothetical protein
MKFILTMLSPLLIAWICSTSTAAPIGSRTSEPDPVLSPEQLKALIVQEYRKDEAKKLANDVIFLRGRRASEVKKYFGDKSPGLSVTPSVTPPPETTGPVPPATPNPCGFTPHLFVRRDRLDTFQLREEAVPLASAKGASVSYTLDQLGNSNSLTINGRLEYLMFGYDGLTPCENGKVGDPYRPFDPFAPHFGYAIAPWVDSQGTINNPAKKGETNNLQAGVDAQVSIYGGVIFDHQYFIVTPYYQTDFRGIAEIQGVRAAWEPVAADVHLGGYAGVPDPYFAWYWQVRGEFDEKHVTAVGATGLARGDYQWLGGTAQLHILLFPGRKDIDPFWEPPVPALVDHFYINASINSYWNGPTGKSVSMFEAELGYNLTPDGKSSISARYNKGTDKDTLLAVQKYLITLNYKY